MTQLEKARECFARGGCSLGQFEEWVEFLLRERIEDVPVSPACVVFAPWSERERRPSVFTGLTSS